MIYEIQKLQKSLLWSTLLKALCDSEFLNVLRSFPPCVLWQVGRYLSWKPGPWLVQTDHVIWILASDWTTGSRPTLVAIWDFVFHAPVHCVDNIFHSISDCHPNFPIHNSCQTKSSSTEVLVDNRTQAEFSWADEDEAFWRGGRELSEDILLPLLKLFLNLTKALFQKNALLSRCFCWAEEEDENDEKRDFVVWDPLASVSSQTSLARVWLGDKELVTDTESLGLKHRCQVTFETWQHILIDFQL